MSTDLTDLCINTYNVDNIMVTRALKYIVHINQEA